MKFVVELWSENPFDKKILLQLLEKESVGVGQQKIVNSSDNKLVCDDCGKKIAKVVVDFCSKHPEWFDGVYCRDCQPEHKKKEEV